jgi:hypothetical protein
VEKDGSLAIGPYPTAIDRNLQHHDDDHNLTRMVEENHARRKTDGAPRR